MPNCPLCKRRAEEDNQDYLQKKYCPTGPSSLQKDGQRGRSGSFGKKKSKVYPLCKRPAEDQLSNQLHGICIQPVGDPLHSHRLISRVELAHQPRGRSVPIERTEVQSHAVYWQESPITGTQPSFSAKQKRYTKCKSTKIQIQKKNNLTIENTQQLFCIFWNL